MLYYYSCIVCDNVKNVILLARKDPKSHVMLCYLLDINLDK